MSGNRGLFREEALRHYLDRRQWGDVLRLPPAWTRWTYPLLLAVLLAALGFLVLGTVRRDVTGVALLRSHGRRVASLEPLAAEYDVLALLPATERRHLGSGQVLRLKVPGVAGPLTAPLHWVSDAPISRAQGRRLFDLDDRGAESLPSSLVLARAGPVAGERGALHDGLVAQAEVTIGAEPVLFALLPGLREALAP